MEVSVKSITIKKKLKENDIKVDTNYGKYGGPKPTRVKAKAKKKVSLVVKSVYIIIILIKPVMSYTSVGGNFHILNPRS